MLAYLRKYDWVMLGSVLAATAFGLVILYSTSLPPQGDTSLTALGATAGDFGNFWKQVVFAAVGLTLALALPIIDYRHLAGASKVIYIFGAVLLASVLIFGRTVRGTTGWFGIGGLGIQPVELVKIILVIFLAKYFSDYARDRDALRPLIGSGLAFAVVFVLTAAQPDFGSAALLGIVWLAMLLIAGVKRKHLIAFIVLGAVVAAVGWTLLLQPYQRDRVLAFVSPSSDPLGRGYNVAQSVIAVGSGGLWGKGLGYGSQGQLRFLPERQTDFIFAVMAEELGFLGVAAVLLLFVAFFRQAYRLAAASRDDFTLFLILGISASLAVEMVINIGGNMRLLPVTGVTLPFLSYGGSSLISKFIAVGLLESVAVRR
jgi:rod shape determining protein RodA